MNKRRPKIPPDIFVLVPAGIFFCWIFVFGERTPLRWLALFGSAVFFAAKIGQVFTSGKQKTGNVLSICSRVGFLTVTGGLILKAFEIIKQQYVAVAGIPVKGTGAIIQGIFLIIFVMALSFYALKRLK